MLIPQLKDVKDICQNILKDCRLNQSDERYGNSLDFFMENGFFSEECWNLDITLAALILPRLIRFKDSAPCYPASLVKEDDEGHIIEEVEPNQLWHEILDKMVYAFWIIVNERGDYPIRLNKKEREELVAAKKEGLKLFAEYFESLWRVVGLFGRL